MAFVDRVWRLAISPRSEWRAIAAEPHAVGRILAAYVAPLVVAAAAAYVAGIVLFGRTTPQGLNYTPPMGSVIGRAAAGAVLWVAFVYAFAQAIDALAPRFGAPRNFDHAFKLAAYAPTALWVGLLAYVVPGFGWIGLTLGTLYSVYLLFAGLPVLMGPPAERAVTYAMACVAAGCFIALLLGLVIRAAFTML
jgi:hypothetical protein